MPRWQAVLPLVVLLVPAPALALKPGKHRSIAEASCKANHLPEAFCRRMGKAVYETDYEEWTDLSAHAQTERGQARCDAADAAITRVDRLARSVVGSAAAGDLQTAAIDLGRALHTIQDECAHHGMTNEQHAFLSLEQTCGDDADVSPDIQPAAITCATERTSAVMKRVASALAGTRWTGVDRLCTDPFADRDMDTCATAVLPTPIMACDFLSLFRDWDGVNSRWNGLVGPALVDAFAAGLANTPASSSVCAGDPSAIDPEPVPRTAVVDNTCGLVDIGCLGKVDGDADVDPYGEEPSAGGCNAAGSPGWLASMFGLMAWGAARRSRGSSRRRSASPRPSRDRS